MTHAELELKRLQNAFEKWADKQSHILEVYPGDLAEAIAHAERRGMVSAAKIFWPFVAHVLNDPIHSAEKTALLNRFKHALGMELMSHEMIGVTLEGKGRVE